MEEKKVDRRVRKTKKQLRQALTKLLQEKPIKDITVREIADMVDINRGTFYLHYKDVYDMLEQTEQEMFAEFNEMLSTAPLLEKEHMPLLKIIFQYFSENADMAQALMGPNGDHAFMNKVKAVLRDRCLQEFMQLHHTAQTQVFDYYYSYAVFGCIGLFQTWLENGLRESPEDMSLLAEQFILHGIQVLE